MKVLIDIAHPAHLHYFRNFSRLFSEKGHEVLFTVRNKGIIVSLATALKLSFVIRSRKERPKIFYAVTATWNIFRAARKFKPDIFIDMGTIFSAPVSWVMRKPHIVFEDTESASRARRLFMPLINAVLTPDIYLGDLGAKQIRFNSFMELFYLHRNQYARGASERRVLPGISPDERYVIMRFVSWEAHHDKGLQGLTEANKIIAAAEFSKYARVIICAESGLPEQLQKYRYTLPPESMHDLIAGASLYFGEGATMATESVILGVPTVYINPNWLGYTIEAEKQGLLFNFRSDPESQRKAIEKGIELLKDRTVKGTFEKASAEYIDTKIDMTAFLVWFVGSWPESFRIMKENPEYQNRFR